MAGTFQTLLGGDELYHYHTKVWISLEQFVVSSQFFELFFVKAYDEGCQNWWSPFMASRLRILVSKRMSVA